MRIIKYCLLLFSSLYLHQTLMAQPNSAPVINPFNLKPDNIGALANSVNLFTGDVSLPLNLVRIPGNGGLGMDVSIQYSSQNIENVVDTWNLESPTSVVGLGWTFSYPMIVVSNKQSGTREDDDYYMVEGGVSNKLFCIAINGGIRTYKTKNYTNWIVTFTAASERWEITKDDGSRFVYGDLSSGRNTVQWGLTFGNWIGDSNLSATQRQGVVWNLSEIRNAWGEGIFYTYLNDENTVGSGSLYQTEASYLNKLTDSWGNEVELVYKNKLNTEYVEPHTELAEPDAYQERYEKRYLDKLIVKAEGVSYYEVLCKYQTNLFGTGNLTKRVLKSITRVAMSGLQSPVVSFEYLTSGTMKGGMSDIKYSTGATVTFEYNTAGVFVEYSERAKTFAAPVGYAEPKIAISDNFTVCVWRQLNGSSHDTNARPIQVQTKVWDGGWRETDLGTVANVKLIDPLNVIGDYIIRAGENCFAILVPTYVGNNHTLYVWYRDQVTPGKWRSGTFANLVIDDPNKKNVWIGDDYVAVTGSTTKIFTFNFDGVIWTTSNLTFTAGDRYYGAGRNFIWTHNANPNPDVVNFYYLDEKRTWVTSSNFTAPFNASAGFNSWYVGDNTAVGMIAGSPEYLYTWNDTYTAVSGSSTPQQYADDSFVSIQGSKIHITDPNGTKHNAFHYNGSSWSASGEQAVHITSYTYNSITTLNMNLAIGYESFAYTKDAITGAFLRAFNPNTSSWLTETSFTSSNGITPDMGPNFYRFEGSLYFRGNSSTVPTLKGTLTPTFTGFESKFGADFLIFRPTLPPSGTYIQFLRNGTLQGSGTEINPGTSVSYHLKKSWIGNNTFVLAAAGGLPEDKTTMYVFRSSNYQYSGKVKDYPVTKVSVNDGTGAPAMYTTYVYDATKATLDPSNNIARYNKVTTYPGASELTKTYGYTETYFFNGLSETELGDTFPKDGALGNAGFYYNINNGLSYRAKTFNSVGSLVASKNTMWYVGSKNIVNNASTPLTLESAYYSRPYRIAAVLDNVETESSNSYDTYANVSVLKEVTKSGANEKQVVETEFTYAWQSYPSLVNKNILSPVVQSKRKINSSTYVESSVTRWKDWTCSGSSCLNPTVPSPADQYVWRGTNTSGFTWWDVATQTPSSDWKFLGKTVSRDTKCGIEIELQSYGNQSSCQLLDQQRQNVVCAASNTTLSNIAYTGFEVYEDATTGNWTSWESITPTTAASKTGERFLNLGTTGITKGSLNAQVRYVVSFWVKTANGSVSIDGAGTQSYGNLTSWTLYEYFVTGVSSVTIKRSGSTQVSIDEVKIYPLNARMATTTYHPLFGATSATGTSNVTSYSQLDEFGRVKNILDQKGDIVKTFYYNFKQ